MTRRTPIIAIIAIGLMCCFDATKSAATGYFYEHPIRPFNPPPFSTLRSTGQYDGIRIGQKVVTSSRPRLSAPPLPSLNPLTSLTPTQRPRLQTSPYTRAPQSSPTPYTKQDLYQLQQQQLTQQRQQQLQLQQRQYQLQAQKTQQQQQLQQQGQYQRQGQYQQIQTPARTQYTYQQPQRPFPITVQPTIQARFNPQTTLQPTTRRLTPGPTTKLTLRPTQIPTQRITPRLTPQPVVASQSLTSSPPAINNRAQTRPASIATPTTPAKPSVSISNPSQAGVLASPEVYVIDGRQLKQYKVYEEIDNDIDQEVEPFIPPNFFLNSYHARIGPTQPLSDDLQLQSRFSGQTTSQPNNVQQQRQQQQNTVALGSGGLGFVRLPNGNVYLGSGSLGYISGLQRSQDVEDARTRTGSPTPDPLHFGHGPLSDSFYYQSSY